MRDNVEGLQKDPLEKTLGDGKGGRWWILHLGDKGGRRRHLAWGGERVPKAVATHPNYLFWGDTTCLSKDKFSPFGLYSREKESGLHRQKGEPRGKKL